MITAHDSQQDSAKAFVEGVDFFISKPFTRAQINEVIDKLTGSLVPKFSPYCRIIFPYFPSHIRNFDRHQMRYSNTILKMIVKVVPFPFSLIAEIVPRWFKIMF